MLRLCDGWDIQTCVAYFMDSARQAFEPRSILGYFRRIPWLYRAVEVGLTLLYDSKYPSNNLNALLQNEYGPRRSIMDHSWADEMGIKYGLTLTTADKTETVVASSYNGVGSERRSPGAYLDAGCILGVTETHRLCDVKAILGYAQHPTLGDVGQYQFQVCLSELTKHSVRCAMAAP